MLNHIETWRLRFFDGSLHPVVLAVFYLGIIAGLLVLYGKGDFSTPGFIYQEF